MSAAPTTERVQECLPEIRTGDARVVDLLRDLVIKGVVAIVDEHHRLTTISTDLRASITETARVSQSSLLAIAASTARIEEVLASGGSPGTIGEQLAILRRSTRHLERMVEELLATAGATGNSG
jgi:hypothetical protein